jgi:CYTH domain-containing protein
MLRGMPSPGIEIERKFLLDAMPALPEGAVPWRIEQGYLSPWSSPREGDKAGLAPGDIEFGYGRLRRSVMPNGSIVCTHTVKTGTGLQRSERERVIKTKDFERHWPRTQGRRLSKTRWRVPHGGVTWEIDDIHDGFMVLAEVELETPDQAVAPPAWLAPHIVREVTDDPMYTNSAIAERLAGGVKR